MVAVTLTPTNQTAIRQGIIDVPLFDPAYSVSANTSWIFSRSSDRPHFNDGFFVDANGLIQYQLDCVLTPFAKVTTERGSKVGGTSTGSKTGILKADSLALMTGFGFPTVVYSDHLLVTGGLSITDPKFPNTGFIWTNDRYGITPNINTQGDMLGFWVPGSEGIKNAAFYWGMETFDLIGPTLQRDYMLAPLVSGGPPTPPFEGFFGAPGTLGPFNVQGWTTANVSAFQARANAFTNFVNQNIIAYTTSSTVGGTNLFILSMHFVPGLGPLYGTFAAMMFDDPNIQTIINDLAFDIQGTNFGWVISWQGSNYPLIQGQGSQSILLTCSIDPDSDLFGFRYAPIRWNTKTTKAAAAVSAPGIPNIKIDPNGIMYMQASGSGSDPTYVGNSAGLDINIPGVQIPTNDLTGNLALPSFCPCSPVAVDIAG